MNYFLFFLLTYFSFPNLFFGQTNDSILLAKTNQLRLSKGLKPLQTNSSLLKMAYLHAENMAKDNFFSHYHPKSKKVKSPADRASLLGFQFEYLSENIAVYESSKQISADSLSSIFFEIWKNSKVHFKNMIAPEPTLAGMVIYSYIRKNKFVYYAVQNFGKTL